MRLITSIFEIILSRHVFEVIYRLMVGDAAMKYRFYMTAGEMRMSEMCLPVNVNFR